MYQLCARSAAPRFTGRVRTLCAPRTLQECEERGAGWPVCKVEEVLCGWLQAQGQRGAGPVLEQCAASPGGELARLCASWCESTVCSVSLRRILYMVFGEPEAPKRNTCHLGSGG